MKKNFSSRKNANGNTKTRRGKDGGLVVSISGLPRPNFVADHQFHSTNFFGIGETGARKNSRTGIDDSYNLYREGMATCTCTDTNDI